MRDKVFLLTKQQQKLRYYLLTRTHQFPQAKSQSDEDYELGRYSSYLFSRGGFGVTIVQVLDKREREKSILLLPVKRKRMMACHIWTKLRKGRRKRREEAVHLRVFLCHAQEDEFLLILLNDSHVGPCFRARDVTTQNVSWQKYPLHQVKMQFLKTMALWQLKEPRFFFLSGKTHFIKAKIG